MQYAIADRWPGMIRFYDDGRIEPDSISVTGI